MPRPTPPLTPQIERSIVQHITQISGHPFEIRDRQSISGGDINLAYKLSNQPHSHSPHSYFLKINHADRIEMFEAEAEALRQLQSTHTIRVPTPICTGTTDAVSYIVLEFLDLVPIVPSYESGRLFDTGIKVRIIADIYGQMERCVSHWHKDNISKFA